MNSQQLSEILDYSSTKNYNITYTNNFHFNHISHGVISLFRLGADQVKLQKFTDNYVEKLEKPQDHPEQMHIPLCDDYDMIKGEGKYFYPLVEYYQHKLDDEYHGDIAAALRGVLPNLASGMLGVAFHGIIHLGYSLMTNHSRLFVESLAVLHYTHTRMMVDEDELTPPLSDSGDLDIMDVLEIVRNDLELSSYLKENVEKVREEPRTVKCPNSFTKGMRILLESRVLEIMSYVEKISMPACYCKALTGDRESLDELCHWIINAAIKTYAFSKKVNDFFLLHLITSAWCFRHILLSITQVEDIKKLTRIYIFGVISTYLVQGCPDLHPLYAEIRVIKGDCFWDDVIKEIMGQDDVDEHIYKVLDVCKAMSDVNKDSHMEPVYRAAVRCTIDEPSKF